jgi:hypothetical protein
MQDIDKQAKKNGVALINYGRCQFCGSHTEGGVYGCFDIYNNMASLVKMGSVEHFLWADAHALQHSEVHGKWNNNLHLTRLYLITQRKMDWNFEKTPLLSKTLNLYKINNEQKIIISPPALSRGEITVTDFIKIQTEEALIKLVQKWANKVYDSYSLYHSTANEIGEIFIEKYEKR